MDALLIFLCLFSFSVAQFDSKECTFKGKSGVSGDNVYDLNDFDTTKAIIQGGDYSYEVSLCSELTCGSSDAGVCQSGNWNCGKLSSIEERANGLFIHFDQGDGGRSSKVVLACAETTALTNIFENNLFYTLIGQSPAACGTKQVCTFTGESGVYDLSLFDTEVSVEDSQGYTYKFNPCGLIDCGKENGAGVCQTKKDDWPRSCGELIEMKIEESENGLVFFLSNGADQRASTIVLTCDETTALTNIFEEPQYRYTLIGRSPAACLPKDPNSDSSSSSDINSSSSSDKGSPNEMNTHKSSDGLTGGQTVAIVLASCFFLIIVLLVLFIVFMKRRNKGNGDEVQMKVNHTVEHRKDKKANKSSESENEH